MSKILELREKRAKVWDAAKAFLDSKRGGDGLLSAEDTQTYEKMEESCAIFSKISSTKRSCVIWLSKIFWRFGFLISVITAHCLSQIGRAHV